MFGACRLHAAWKDKKSSLEGTSQQSPPPSFLK